MDFLKKVNINLFKNPLNIILAIVLSVLISYIIRSMVKDLFYGIDDFIIGAPTLIGYPKKIDLFFTFSIMILFPLLVHIIEYPLNKYIRPFIRKNRFNISFKISIHSEIWNKLKNRIILNYHSICFLFGAIGLYGIISFLSRVSFIFLSSSNIKIIYFSYFLFGIFSLFAFLLISKKLSTESVKKIYSYLIIILQIFFALFLYLLLPLPYQKISGELIYPIEISKNLYILIATLVILGFVDLIYRAKKIHKKQAYNILSLLSPVMISFLLTVLFFIYPVGVPILSNDDYHFGEKLLPYFLYKEYGMLPYTKEGYVLAHGFLDMAGAFFGDLFVNKANVLTAQSIIYGKFLASAIGSMLVFIIISYSFNLTLSLLIIIFPALLSINFLLPDTFSVLFFYILLLNPKLLRSPFKWLLAYGFISLIMVLYSAGIGAAMTLSFIPLVFYMLYLVFQKKELLKKDNLISLFLALLIILILLIFTPLFNIYLGLINILLENTSINLEGYGIPWILFFHTFMIRDIWILIIPILFVLSLSFLKDKQKLIGFTCLSITLFPILIMPYALGRIDPGLTRTGAISILYIFFIIPVLLYLLKDIYGNKFYRESSLYLFVFGILFLNLTQAFYITKIHPPNTYQKLFSETSTHKAINGQDYGIERIGKVIIEKHHLNILKRLKIIFDKYLEKQDSYLDLTNRNAQYFYTNRKLLIESGAYYNMAHPNQGLRSLTILKKYKPKLILLQFDHGNITHDALILSMRVYPIYRWLLLSNYKIIKENDMIFALRNDIYNQFFKSPMTNDIFLLDKAIRADVGTTNLKKIPLSWGYSYKKLKDKMEFISDIASKDIIGLNAMKKISSNEYEIIDADPFIIFNVSDQKLDGKNTGLILLDIHCDQSSEFKGELFYTNEKIKHSTEEASYKFSLKNGKNIIPVDLSPKWLLGGKLDKIRFDIRDQNSCNNIKINKFAFYQRKIVKEINEK